MEPTLQYLSTEFIPTAVKAIQEKDSETLASFFHEDAKFVNSQGQFVGREEIKQFWQASFDAGLSSFEGRKEGFYFERVGENTVVEQGWYKIDFGEGHFTTVWTKGEDGKYKIKFDSFTDMKSQE